MHRGVHERPSCDHIGLNSGCPTCGWTGRKDHSNRSFPHLLASCLSCEVGGPDAIKMKEACPQKKKEEPQRKHEDTNQHNFKTKEVANPKLENKNAWLKESWETAAATSSTYPQKFTSKTGPFNSTWRNRLSRRATILSTPF